MKIEQNRAVRLSEMERDRAARMKTERADALRLKREISRHQDQVRYRTLNLRIDVEIRESVAPISLFFPLKYTVLNGNTQKMHLSYFLLSSCSYHLRLKFKLRSRKKRKESGEGK
jgi:hypothetical protein